MKNYWLYKVLLYLYLGALGVLGFFLSNRSQIFWSLFYMFFGMFLFLKACWMTQENSFGSQYGIFMLDSVSIFFVLLSFWVVILSLVAMEFNMSQVRLLVVMMGVLLVVMVLFFSVSDVLVFFVFFELSLVPIFFLIKYFSSYKERVFSLYYFFFFTLLSSVPFFLSVAYLVSNSVGEFLFVFFIIGDSLGSLCGLIVFGVLLGFLSKLPVFSLHMWLPKAHVDAPVGGSMILAGVLLKLSGYGVMRLFSFMDFFFNVGLVFFMVVVGLFGYFFASFVCVRVLDLKVVVALSSVSHMSFAFCGLCLSLSWSVKGGYFMFLGHGIVSPVLFYVVHCMMKVFNTRVLSGMKGLYSFSYLLMLMSVVFMLFNIGFPPFINFFSEISIMASVFLKYFFLVFVVFLGFFFSGVYAFNVLGSLGFSVRGVGLFYKVIFLDYFVFVVSLVVFLYMTFFLDVLF